MHKWQCFVSIFENFFLGLDISPLSQSGSQVGGGKVAIFKSVTCRSAKSKPPNFYNENWEEDPMQWGCRIGWFLFVGVIDPIYQCCITKKTFKMLLPCCELITFWLIMIVRTREGQYSRLSDTRPQTQCCVLYYKYTNTQIQIQKYTPLDPLPNIIQMLQTTRPWFYILQDKVK